MSFLASLYERIARISAQTKILQDKIAGGGTSIGESKIIAKFERVGLDSTQATMSYFDAQESSFVRIEMESLSDDAETLDRFRFEESDRWERFRDSYEG